MSTRVYNLIGMYIRTTDDIPSLPNADNGQCPHSVPLVHSGLIESSRPISYVRTGVQPCMTVPPRDSSRLLTPTARQSVSI